MARIKKRIGSGKQKQVVIKIKKNAKMKVIDLTEDAIDTIRTMIVDLCHKSFDEGGCVNDADLDDIEALIRKIAK